MGTFNSKQVPTFPHKVRGLNCRPQKWEVSVLSLCHRGLHFCIYAENIYHFLYILRIYTILSISKTKDNKNSEDKTEKNCLFFQLYKILCASFHSNISRHFSIFQVNISFKKQCPLLRYLQFKKTLFLSFLNKEVQ